MTTGPRTTARLAVLALTAAAAGLGAYAISSALAASGKTHPAQAPPAPLRTAATRAAARAPAPPTAAEFASDFVGATTAYAQAHGEPARIAHPDCVQASAGHYMCSYVVVRPERPRECHLMQATWTPERASSFTVTTSGRVTRCGTLREALRSLR
jgi:hypothetical protein